MCNTELLIINNVQCAANSSAIKAPTTHQRMSRERLLLSFLQNYTSRKKEGKDLPVVERRIFFFCFYYYFIRQYPVSADATRMARGDVVDLR